MNHSHEQHLLGICFNFKEALSQVLAEVRVTDFELEQHRKIFTVIQSINASNAPVDFTTLGSKLQPVEMALVSEASDVAATSATVNYYIQQVLTASNHRRLSELSLQLANDPEDSQKQRLLQEALTPKAKSSQDNKITVVDVFELMRREFPPRENLLAPWLPKQGLAMVYAPRGIGKTHFSLGVAYAVASGGVFLDWKAPRPASVLFVDGEMPAATLQGRITEINESNTKEPSAPFRIITPDLQNPETGMIDLSRRADQLELEKHLDGVELIILDNLSTLCRTGKESEGEGWLPVQEWTLRQRAAGRSVLLVHHSGKNGEQRGTSRREDVLDTVISLKLPADYTQDKGAVFEVHFEKARGIFGEDARPFEAQLAKSPISGLQKWTIKSLDKATYEKVAAMLNEGFTPADIAETLKISKSAVSHAKKKAVGLGLMK
jgi:putative DNA primase/helicase